LVSGLGGRFVARPNLFLFIDFLRSKKTNKCVDGELFDYAVQLDQLNVPHGRGIQSDWSTLVTRGPVREFFPKFRPSEYVMRTLEPSLEYFVALNKNSWRTSPKGADDTAERLYVPLLQHVSVVWIHTEQEVLLETPQTCTRSQQRQQQQQQQQQKNPFSLKESENTDEYITVILPTMRHRIVHDHMARSVFLKAVPARVPFCQEDCSLKLLSLEELRTISTSAVRFENGMTL
jgi:hypothetical protein